MINIPQDWSKLSQIQIDVFLLYLLCNFKKLSVQEEADSVFTTGKYRINNNITIEYEYEKRFVERSDDHGRTWHPSLCYSSNGFKINGKSLPSSRILPSKLYEKCQERCR